ncbi:histidine kinase [Paenibacillus aestuarii]|uniref:Histidine kinase n=1 Tax=Paenibacillus aestuarii TaxID=516965 RepID=A0ABW0K9U3_9BACL|nr:histidine kinase [Paenibacillus aestuarii]
MSEQLLQQILTELKGIKTDQQSMRIDIQELKIDVQELKTSQQSMRVDIQELKTGQQKLEAEIIEIKKDTALIPFIQQAITEASKEIAVASESVRHIEGTLTDHETIIDMLSRRSLEQEAAVKRIK